MSVDMGNRANTIESPLVSVLVPCFNYAEYVGDALRSILSQNYKNFELIIVDDGSTDDSARVIQNVLKEEHGGLVRRAVFLRQENQGVSAALNTALASARGEYIATFDADDLMSPGRLELQVDYLQQNPLVGCVGGEAVRIDEQGRLLPKKDKQRQVRRYDFSQALAKALVVGGGVAMYRREAMDEAGGYDSAIKIQDFQMTLKVAYAGFFVVMLPEVVTLYRKHGDSLSKNYKAEYRYGLELIESYKSHPSYNAAKAKLISRALRLAVTDDKRYAWKLFTEIPLGQWDRKLLRRLRHFFIKKSIVR